MAVGDYDNDGWPDIYVANFGKNRLYHNNHDGTFTDVAEKAGVTLGGWSTGPTWGDYDHDGLLDLFVPGYVKFDADHPPIAGQGEIPAELLPISRNRGDVRPARPAGRTRSSVPQQRRRHFYRCQRESRRGRPDGYYGLASVFVDVDDDGWVDLAVANDSTPNYLYRNRHNGTFEDVSYASGFALSEDGREQASMGNRRGRLQPRRQSRSVHHNFLG